MSRSKEELEDRARGCFSRPEVRLRITSKSELSTNFLLCTIGLPICNSPPGLGCPSYAVEVQSSEDTANSTHTTHPKTIRSVQPEIQAYISRDNTAMGMTRPKFSEVMERTIHSAYPRIFII